MSALISVTPDNVETVLSDLPRVVRLAFGFGSKLRRGTLDVTLPDGRILRLGGIEPGPSAAMTLYNYGFASRLLNGGDIGIAEAYLHGEWDTPDLTQFLYLFCVNHDLIQQMLGDNPLMRYVQIVRHWFNRNTRRQARKNIFAHYDIGNAFYSAWLDPSMTYSSALFEEHTPDLAAAQNNKYRRLAEAIDLQPGQRLLEIGCGWGGFAEYAARTYGAKVVGLTISKEQRDFAHARIHNAGLADKVGNRSDLVFALDGAGTRHQNDILSSYGDIANFNARRCSTEFVRNKFVWLQNRGNRFDTRQSAQWVLADFIFRANDADNDAHFATAHFSF